MPDIITTTAKTSFNDIVSAIGQGSTSSALISAWAPKLAPIIISASVILYLEDG